MKNKYPREMYVWNDNILHAYKQKVIYKCSKHERPSFRYITIRKDSSIGMMQNAMDIEEYEKLYKKDQYLKEIQSLKTSVQFIINEILILENKIIKENQSIKN